MGLEGGGGREGGWADFEGVVDADAGGDPGEGAVELEAC